ncbi:hypothetical protein WME76_08775 [Sorangium sp. So ce119]|uniref:hypothetical protein n=1 Tax=Sorangium sp. So ce119 TaxID=3133279 RepID=UPI003F61EFA7
MRAQPTTPPRLGDGSSPLGRGASAARPPWLRPLAASLAAAGAALLALALLGPVAMVAFGKRSAAACLASIEAPRGPALPDCRPEIRWFALPSRLPWTDEAASAHAEELGVRAAVAEYIDAAVGRPARAALASAAEALGTTESMVAAGSRRITFDALGPACGAPRLGREAAKLGDRRALLERADRWPDWHVRVHALRAALTEGDLPRALAIASGYAGMDPRDEDLRTTTGAILCLGNSAEAKRGVELLTLNQNDRASKRHAGMARNWGEIRAVLVACAARAGVEPPPTPEDPEAGVADAVEARLAQRARLAAAIAGPGAAEAKQRALRAIRDLLGSAAALAPEARRDLLAVVLAEDDAIDAAEAAALALPEAEGDEPATGEEGAAAIGAAGAAPAGVAPALRAGSPLAIDWLPERGLARPAVAGSLRARAAARAAELAVAPRLSPPERDALRAAAGALALDAARELALEGDAPAAIDALDRLGALAPELAPELAPDAARALARSSAWLLAGDRDRALDLIERVDLAAAPPSLRAAVLLQRAELLASRGRRLDAARAAVLADEESAARSGPARGAPGARPGLDLLDVRARWTRLALARPPEAAPLRQGSPPAALPADPSAAWPWVGFASLDAPWARADQPALSRALAAWSAARDAPPTTRRALRYAALRRRGDAPPALVPYAALAAQLLGDGEGDVEVWLDALLAIDAARFSLRHYTFARAEAARWRGDDSSAAAWQRRHDALRAVAADPTRAEIARYLGL